MLIYLQVYYTQTGYVPAQQPAKLLSGPTPMNSTAPAHISMHGWPICRPPLDPPPKKTKLTPPQVHFIIASCENMVAGKGLRPGDVLTAANGKTVEVNK